MSKVMKDMEREESKIAVKLENVHTSKEYDNSEGILAPWMI